MAGFIFFIYFIQKTFNEKIFIILFLLLCSCIKIEQELFLKKFLAEYRIIWKVLKSV